MIGGWGDAERQVLPWFLAVVCIDMHEFDRGCPDANYFRGHGDQSSTALSNFFAAWHSDKRRDKRKGAKVKVSHGRHVLLHVP